ncbi:hypothetical protein B0H21DRAFT_727749 [Amylocystis lapponica]|nr:hypothetical protein B0H21DRAFT_727749 [Amylocystis lapponica]
MTASDLEFSSNRHTTALKEYQVLVRHPELCFEDANLAVVAGHQYFLVHQGLLRHHSEVLDQVLRDRDMSKRQPIEGRPALYVEDSPEDMANFLRALYGSCLDLASLDFQAVAALLRMSTTYCVEGLRREVIRVLAVSWPATLLQWELREKKATNSDGVYSPRPTLPHPILIIELAQEVNARELLPSAFYDLSRYLPSQLAVGHITSCGARHQLGTDDLMKVLRGKEQAARFFSTFIVNELEGRSPSQWCLHRHDPHPLGKRACQIAFEAVTFELIRDVNGMVCNRNSDPLFAIADSVLMQTREDAPGVESTALYRACEACRLDYGSVVDAVREDFWRRIPEWFDVQVDNWGP